MVKNIFKFEFFKVNVLWTIKRFPIPLFYLLLTNWLFIYLINFNINTIDKSKIVSLILTLILSFFLSVWIKLTLERLNNYFYDIFSYILLALFSVLFYNYNTIYDFNSFQFISYIITGTFIFSYLFIAPFIKEIAKWTISQNMFYAYIYKLWVLIIYWFIIWWVLLLLWILWITTVESLFWLNSILSSYNAYENWLSLSTAFFPVLYCLWKFPNKDLIQNEHINENKFTSFLIKYISIPFIYLYFIILYSYTIKVLINFNDWPKWEVSWLVIIFSIFWYIIYLFSYIYQENNSYIKVFRKFFPYVVIPQTLMLLYSIYLRINQYDITINRYLTVVFWLSLLFISLYYIFSKKKHLYFVILFISITSILISIGPWWIYTLSESRQEKKLVRMLSENNIINNGIINYEEWKKVNSIAWNDIYSSIEYLCWINNCRSIAKIFPKDFEEIKINYYNTLNDNDKKYSTLPTKWYITNEITKKINISYNYNIKESDNFLNVSSNYKEDFPIDISWYDLIIKLENKDDSNNNYYWYISRENWKSKLVIINNKKIENEYPLDEINLKLEKKLENNKNISTLASSELTFDVNKNVKIIFSNYSFYPKDYKESGDKKNDDYFYDNGFILIKK